MPKKDRYIDGIYNYCDRWCERCPKTARCRLYADQMFDPEDLEANDASNEAFWDVIASSLRQARETIEAAAAEHGIDLDDLDDDDPPPRRRTTNRQHRIVIEQSHRYAMSSHAWLNANERLFAGSESAEAGGQTNHLRDAIDIVGWYHFFINVKLRRALEKEDDEDDDPIILQASRMDCLGSIKVALIALDRSIAAWGIVLDHLPRQRGEIVEFLHTLDQIRGATEQLLPEARGFIRPGLDTDSN